MGYDIAEISRSGSHGLLSSMMMFQANCGKLPEGMELGIYIYIHTYIYIYIYMISVGKHSKIQRNYRFTSHYTIRIFPKIMHIIPVNLAVAFINIQLGMMYELWSWKIIKWGNFKNATFTCDYLRVCKNGKQLSTSLWFQSIPLGMFSKPYSRE